MEKIVFNDERGKLVELEVGEDYDFNDYLKGIEKGMPKRKIPLNPVGFISNGDGNYRILHDKEDFLK